MNERDREKKWSSICWVIDTKKIIKSNKIKKDKLDNDFNIFLLISLVSYKN
mgnify:CR=1 FL=1